MKADNTCFHSAVKHPVPFFRRKEQVAAANEETEAVKQAAQKQIDDLNETVDRLKEVSYRSNLLSSDSAVPLFRSGSGSLQAPALEIDDLNETLNRVGELSVLSHFPIPLFRSGSGSACNEACCRNIGFDMHSCPALFQTL
jgi:hypothetical protein